MASSIVRNLSGDVEQDSGVDISKDWEEYAELNNLKLTSDKKYNEIRQQLYKKNNLKELEDATKVAGLSAKEKAKREKAYRDAKDAMDKKALEATRVYELKILGQISHAKQAEIHKNEAEALTKKKDRLEQEFQNEMYILEATGASKEELAKAEEEHANRQIELSNKIKETKKAQYAAEKAASIDSIDNFNKKMDDAKNRFSVGFNDGIAGIKEALEEIDLEDIVEGAEKKKEAAQADYDLSREELQDEINKLAEMEKEGSGATQEEIEAQRALVDEKAQEKHQKEKELVQAQAMDAAAKSMKAAADAIKNGYNQAFVEAETILTSYMGHIDARLQGSTKDFDSIMNKVSTNLSLSPYVKTQKVLEKMREAVDQGIVYNLEQRAFLSTISDKIANTFDAFNGNLTRLIRLQQADTTAARLGMEAALTKFLNEMFEDSSYLKDNQSQQVIGSLIDASSTMTKESAAEFEFVVNKWMGSLHSVGLDSNTINSLVESINYLATGDVQSLSSNTQMQTLLAMSASKAGLDYSKLLLDGLNASNTNKLLESMVGYLAEIAEGSENMVVRSAYGDVLGMNMSDFSAISNLNKSDLSNISSVMMSYSDMNTELQNQFNQLDNRTALAEKLSNLYNNAMFGVAQDMVNNPVTYAMTKMLNFMEDQKINMNIPFVNAMGFGVDLNANVQDLLRLGLGVGQTISLVSNIVGSLNSGGGLKLDEWGFNETTSRGSGLGFKSSTALSETSSSTYVTNNNSKDMQNSALNKATDDAKETGEITNKNSKSEHTFDDLYKATIGSSASSWITAQEMFIRQVFNAETEYLSVRDIPLYNFLDTLKNAIVIDNKVQVHDYEVNESLGVLDNTLFTYFGKDGSVSGDISTSMGYLSRVSSTIIGDGTNSKMLVEDVSSTGILGSIVKLLGGGDGALSVALLIATLSGYIGEGLGTNVSTLSTNVSSMKETLESAYATINPDGQDNIFSNISSMKTTIEDILGSMGTETGIGKSVNSILTSLSPNNGVYSLLYNIKGSTANLDSYFKDGGHLRTKIDNISTYTNTIKTRLSTYPKNIYDKIASIDDSVTSVKYTSGKSTMIRTSINNVSEAIPVVIVDGKDTSSIGENNSSNVIKDAIQAALSDKTQKNYIRVLSAAGADLIPVDTELISGGDSGTFRDANDKQQTFTATTEATNSGYKPGTINWN